MSPPPRTRRAGFTLIELSIVLVIIGLIIGGVLVGQNLIHSAQIRATLTQIGKLNTAVNTFSDKFGGLPGDLSNYAVVGMYVPSGLTPSLYLGDGLLQSSMGDGTLFDGEIGTFFADLSLAGLLEVNNMVQVTDATPTTSNQATLATYMLPAAIGNTNYIWAAMGSTPAVGLNIKPKHNYYRLSGVTTLTTGLAGLTTPMKLTTTDAAAIDNKLDDGIPNTGNVEAVDNTSGIVRLTPAANDCSSAAGVYDVAANPTKYECSLVIQVDF